MTVKDILKSLLGVAARFADTDGDGKVEIADIPGALAKAASMQATGLAMAHAGQASYEAIKAAATANALTSGGKDVPVSEVEVAWAKSKVPYSTGATEARAALAKVD